MARISDPAQRMNEQERRANALLANAGVWDASHLTRLIRQRGTLVSRPTVRRYLYEPPERVDLRVCRALAQELGYPDDLDGFIAALYGDDKGRYFHSLDSFRPPVAV